MSARAIRNAMPRGALALVISQVKHKSAGTAGAMAKRASPDLWIVRLARGHAKLWCAIAVGLVVYALLPADWRAVTRMLVGWDAGVAAYLVLAAAMMAGAPAA